MALPEPVLSGDDITVAEKVLRNPSSQISNPWITDPTKLAILRAMDSCLARFGHHSFFDAFIVDALAQKSVCFRHSYSLKVEGVHY